MLTRVEVTALSATFPELDWMSEKDWNDVAEFADWRTWIDDVGSLNEMLKARVQRVAIRADCREYFGEENVPNVNDPDDQTWA